MSKPTAKPAASGVCEWCRELKDKLSFCARCGIARYCSSKCQAKHWPRHAGICRSLKTERTGQQLDLPTLVKDIAASLSIQAPEDFLPYYLNCPIRKKEKKSESEILIYLAPAMGDKPVEPRCYDMTATSFEASSRSFQRMFGIGLGSIVNRAAALAVNSALMLDKIQLSVEGRPVTGMAMYRSEPGVPLWTVVLNSLDAESEELQSEPQDREHLWLGFKVKPADPASVTDDVYFVDFNAMALGLFDSEPYNGGSVFLVSGWSTELRHRHPLIYRTGSIYRDQEYLDRWAQLWPEIKNFRKLTQQAGNLDFQHHLLASKVFKVDMGIQYRQEGTQ